MDSAEELNGKLNRLDMLHWMAQLKSRYAYEGFHERWRDRLEQYKLNLINQFKSDWCKQQRKLCMEEHDANWFLEPDKLSDIILNTPEPV